MLKIEKPLRRPIAPRGQALWQLGFRPFYLAAAMFSALSIGLWTLQMQGVLPGPYLAGPLWHAHEMIFGFALAVIVGFLFTAGHNWTQQATPTGGSLAALVGLWLAGRVLVLTPWGWAAALANVAFPLAAAAAIAVPLVRSGNRRNYFFVALLVAIGIASLLVHLGQLGVMAAPPWLGIQAALDMLLFILAVMGGRVIPMFTNNGVRGADARRDPWVERLALGSVLALLAADLFGLKPVDIAGIAAIAALAHLVRLLLWQPWRTARVPLVWVLHLAYAWIPIHLALRSLAAAGVVSSSLSVHALTAGALGGLVIGMMTRTSRGHTARPLKADHWDVACYALVAGAALLRVAVPLVLPAAYPAALALSGLAWSLAFALFAVRYAPWLMRVRPDGRPG